MATLRNGVHGMISGKIGSLVYYEYRGKQVVRSLPKKSKKAPSVAQQSQRLRFGLVCNFLNSFNSLITEGYKTGKKMGNNQFVSHHTKGAILGVFPEFTLDYSKVVLTRGHLITGAARVCSDSAAKLTFEWENYHHYLASSTDNAILIVYNPAKHQQVWLKTTVTRDAQTAQLPIPKSFSGDTLHCWLAFVSKDEKRYSTSSYLGTIVNHLKIN